MVLQVAVGWKQKGQDWAVQQLALTVTNLLLTLSSPVFDQSTACVIKLGLQVIQATTGG